eukprot:1147024-Pelagomonas_calceolata.AAC.6
MKRPSGWMYAWYRGLKLPSFGNGKQCCGSGGLRVTLALANPPVQSSLGQGRELMAALEGLYNLKILPRASQAAPALRVDEMEGPSEASQSFVGLTFETTSGQAKHFSLASRAAHVRLRIDGSSQNLGFEAAQLLVYFGDVVSEFQGDIMLFGALQVPPQTLMEHMLGVQGKPCTIWVLLKNCDGSLDSCCGESGEPTACGSAAMVHHVQCILGGWGIVHSKRIMGLGLCRLRALRQRVRFGEGAFWHCCISLSATLLLWFCCNAG